MESDLYVPDANVFLEYIYDRPLKHHAQQIIHDAVLDKIRLIVPSLLLDEITEVLCGNLNSLEEVKLHIQYLDTLIKEGILNIIIPDSAVRIEAITIARTGNPKSGYPELTDSLYHALAILNGASFITNDQRHIAKVKAFGHIMPLSEYV